jgi:hypothetical protein
VAVAVVVVGHRAPHGECVPEGQLDLLPRETVDVLDYAKGGQVSNDAEWWNSPESQWWLVRRRRDGKTGYVPGLTCLTIIEEGGETAQKVGTGFAAADDGGAGGDGGGSGGVDNGDNRLIPVSEWNLGCCGRLKKFFGEMQYNEWSKHAQLFAFYIVLLQGICVLGWDFGEGVRISEGQTIGIGNSTGIVVEEVSKLDDAVAVGSMLAYLLFIILERWNFCRKIKDLKDPEKGPSWAEKMKADGPPKLVRLLCPGPPGAFKRP